jgi:hypothetical protein
MRLDPAPQESGRNREANALGLHVFQIHPREPARIDVLANARPQAAFDTRPTFLFRICHCSKLFQKEEILPRM